jgi:hypothetical protein
VATRNLSARNPLKDIGRNPPVRKTMGPDGVMVTEKLCPIPFNIKMVAPDGDVVVIGLATGFTIRGFRGNDYGVQLLEDKKKAGFLPFKECPLLTRSFPRAAADVACEGEFTDDKCCPHINKVIAARREEYRKKQNEYGRNFATNQDRIIALLEKQAESTVSERPGAPPGKKGGMLGG